MKRSGVFALLLGVVALAAACTQTATAPATPAPTGGGLAAAQATPGVTVPAKVVPSGRFTYGYASFPASVDPHNIEFTTGLHMLRGVYDGLLELGRDGTSVVPVLATSWRNVDQTTWEFTLRTGVRFHNGDVFDANVVKFNVERAANPANRLLINASLATLLQEARVIAPDTVQIVTRRPDPMLPRMLFPLMMISPGTESTIRDRAVGTGPLRVESVDIGRGEMVQRPFLDSWRQPIRPAEVSVKRIAETPVRRAALQTGEIDITVLPAETIDPFRNAEFRIKSLLNGSSVSLEMFPADTVGPLSDIRVRRAVQAALNVQEIIDTLFVREGEASACQLTDRRAFGFNPGLRAPVHDLEGARRLLREAGLPDGFAAKLLYIPTSTIIGTDIAQAVAGQLGRAGIRIELVGVEFGVYSQIRANGGQPDMVLQVGNFSATMDTSTPLAIYRYRGQPPAKRFNSERFNQVFDASVTEFNLQRREQLLQEAARILCEEQGTAFMYQNNTQYISRARLDGFDPGPDLNPRFWTVGVRN